VGVALGWGFTLVVTDAGAVFSCGISTNAILGHGSLDCEVLPRRINALMHTGRRFVAVAAGHGHALALAEEGELYGWGDRGACGHGCVTRTPRRVAALTGSLIDERVKLVDAQGGASCAVTEKGELFTWGSSNFFNLGHGVDTPQATPKRVQGLGGRRLAAASISVTHTLVADEDGVVWALGLSLPLAIAATPDPGEQNAYVKTPTPIQTLRVRALKSP